MQFAIEVGIQIKNKTLYSHEQTGFYLQVNIITKQLAYYFRYSFLYLILFDYDIS